LNILITYANPKEKKGTAEIKNRLPKPAGIIPVQILINTIYVIMVIRNKVAIFLYFTFFLMNIKAAKLGIKIGDQSKNPPAGENRWINSEEIEIKVNVPFSP